MALYENEVHAPQHYGTESPLDPSDSENAEENVCSQQHLS
jgi:hypothetical protein